jgi:DNA-binding protein HU-beta
MNKSELIAGIADLSGLTKTDSERALSSFIQTIERTLKSGDDVRLVGFGTFSVTKRGATVARNPRTGKEIKIPERTVPKFKAGKQLKEAVAKK